MRKGLPIRVKGHMLVYLFPLGKSEDVVKNATLTQIQGASVPNTKAIRSTRC